MQSERRTSSKARPSVSEPPTDRYGMRPMAPIPILAVAAPQDWDAVLERLLFRRKMKITWAVLMRRKKKSRRWMRLAP